jgi:peptide deformylase
MILPIVKYGSSTLRKKAFNVDGGDPFQEIASNMLATLKKAEGVGLAGPQVALLKNIFVIDTSPYQDDGIELLEKMFINPEILDSDDTLSSFNEGCLSIPGINEDVIRPEKIHVRYRDDHFDLREETLDGVVARIFQHEFDHLQGTLFIDRINPLRKRMIKSKLKAIEKTYKK